MGWDTVAIRVLLFAALLGIWRTGAAANDGIDRFIARDKFQDIVISPDGDYYAATVPLERSTQLIVLRRSDNAIVTREPIRDDVHVRNVWWIGPERLVYDVVSRYGDLDEPQPTGALFALNADGTDRTLLSGLNLRGKGAGLRGTNFRVDWLLMADPIGRGDGNHVLVLVLPQLREPHPRAEWLNVHDGKRELVVRAPLAGAAFVTDNVGEVRFAFGQDRDNLTKVFYRRAQGPWEPVKLGGTGGETVVPVGFSADDRLAYFQISRASGPDAIESWDPVTGQRHVVALDSRNDPHEILFRPGTRTAIGVRYTDERQRTVFFDEATPEARFFRQLEAAFPGDSVEITSATRDGRLALVKVSSDRQPGDFYLFDAERMTAEHVASRRSDIEVARMARMVPYLIKTRDGTPLRAFLTRPLGADEGAGPLVVVPHGGPYGIYDEWAYSPESQLLAAAGYTVLQVNFRGSGNYGADFQRAGAGEWGGVMQDDLTDATRWAVKEGIAAPDRMCIYGASYGAYAALMGVAKEPDLYRCAIGYVGVYDLPTLYFEGDVRRSRQGRLFLADWVGDRATLTGLSPTRLAERIKVPVFLAAGGRDERAPLIHSEMMEKALRSANVPVQSLYYENEGHGFFVEAHRREFYTRLLAFLDQHIGTVNGRSDSEAVPDREPSGF
ncbi:alpha/beta hydrolase family protein [Pseudoxanthomonas sp.]|uniref:alpha/beta hydrolase family protein n=1 Tax=Pseudoxanthomonas sp. TaxID=1871049 RepID=UPI003F7E0210